MENKKRLNVSGYRGVWGETLTKDVVIMYTRAFVSFLKEKNKNPTILIGRDGRESGPEIRKYIINELKSLGISYIDGNILPTPTVLFSVRKHQYTGGIIITASHNPIEYNGLKFVNDKGLFLIKDEVDKVNYFYEEEIKNSDLYRVNLNKFSFKKYINSFFQKNPNFLKEHADEILKNVNVEAIRAKKFKVVVDMINASAAVMDPYLFKQLGVELLPLNNVPNGKFGHRPEPLKENLQDISKLAKESKADLGFVHDPDADRLVIVNENGDVISEECSVALAIESTLSKNPGKNVVVNLSTSRMADDIAQKYGGQCFRTKIGEGFVVEGMLENDAVIGGEGNGGIIYPKINRARDSFVGVALILNLLAEKNMKISEVVAELPKYVIKKDKWGLGMDLSQMYAKLKTYFNNANTNENDGIRFDFPDYSWIHLRPSNTEPIIRLFGEAKTQERIDSLFEEAKKVIM